MDYKDKEKILLAKYPKAKENYFERKDFLEKKIKDSYTEKEFKKRSNEVLERELP